MIRILALSAALATASAVALAAPASAQSYGGVTLSFGSGGYAPYGYNETPYERGGYYSYPAPPVRSYYYDDGRAYAWRAHQREEQIERWQQEQQRRRYWEQERREHQRWHYHNDDDD